MKSDGVMITERMNCTARANVLSIGSRSGCGKYQLYLALGKVTSFSKVSHVMMV